MALLGRRGRDVGAGIEGRAVGMLGVSVDLDDALDGGETGLPRIAALRYDPVDDLRGGVGAGLDAAMALLDHCCADQLGGWGGAKIVDNIGFEDIPGAIGWSTTAISDSRRSRSR
jgi:hypothetical protein